MRVSKAGSTEQNAPAAGESSSEPGIDPLAWRLLLGVGVLYIVAQFVLFSMPRFLGYDEAIYYAEVTPGVRAISFTATRARGITFLISPVTAVGASVGMIRAYLAVVSGVLLVASFRIWIPLIGRAATVAAALIGFTWLGLFYGSAIYPNLFLAFASVAAAGFVARGLVKDERRCMVWAGVAVGLAALFRPIDAVWLAGGVGVVTLVRDPRRAFTRLVPIGLGLIVGWTPWLVEGYYRFGGPLARVRGSVDSARGIGFHIVDQLRMADGPLLGTDPAKFGPINKFAALWWAVVGVLAVAGVVHVRRARSSTPLMTALVAGLVLAFPYVVLTWVLNPRYLLPVYALMGIPAALGLRAIWRASGRFPMVAATSLVGLLGLLGVWHAGLANAIERDQVRLANIALELGRTLQQRADGHPCAFASLASFPQIEIASGCDGTILHPARNDELNALAARARRGERVYVLSSAEPPASSVLWKWQSEFLDLRSTAQWSLYEP